MPSKTPARREAAQEIALWKSARRGRGRPRAAHGRVTRARVNERSQTAAAFERKTRAGGSRIVFGVWNSEASHLRWDDPRAPGEFRTQSPAHERSGARSVSAEQQRGRPSFHHPQPWRPRVRGRRPRRRRLGESRAAAAAAAGKKRRLQESAAAKGAFSTTTNRGSNRRRSEREPEPESEDDEDDEVISDDTGRYRSEDEAPRRGDTTTDENRRR